MLLQLNIRNFALIRDISVSFEKGFNVLLGETGAGKSILIDAIDYVLGGKFEKSLIRIGENKTYVEAIFSIENENTREILDKKGIEYEEDILIISRETFQSGKNVAKVNGKSMILSDLKEITTCLLDIHGQHKNQSLLDSSNYIDYLDSYGREKIEKLLSQYTIYYNRLKEIDSKIDELIGETGEKEKLVDFLKYQIDEINKGNLKIGEEEELEEKFTNLSNYEKLNKALGSSYALLNSGDGDSLAICDAINLVLKNIKEVENFSERLGKIYSFFEETYYNIQEAAEDLRDIVDNLYYDQEELEIINKRMYEIDNYKRKYGNSIKEILDYREEMNSKYEEMINYKEIVEGLNKEKKKIISNMEEKSEQIHIIRSDLAKDLEEKVKEELSYVGLDKADFKINVQYSREFNEKGRDIVQFLISTNPGQPLKELAKVVSGGELSRIMLSLKTVFIDKDDIPSIIFDEIDTGISGRIAERVGEKMYMVSTKHQVFCITHLPQIAIMSDNHYLVQKNVEENETYTNIIKISEDDKVKEIAKMISGSNLTDLALKNSKELINNGYNKKHSLCKK
ncbi:DNA repair protein RecN [Haloimpatiens lingqiaonensis]|uniref:DNA repair protein RecN n=1 Tax=Haloimpatiens lingqiaonensis TaxID=1380675 RepID=UPI0010FD725F|nr:DNA repair protein RecN [Haloimpatiens lingqiaonensis]